MVNNISTEARLPGVAAVEVREPVVRPSTPAPAPVAPEQAQQAAKQAEQEAKRPQPESSARVVALANFLKEERRGLQFQVNEETGDVIVKVIDLETQEVIREIPPEEVRRLAEKIAAEDQRGVFVYERA